LNTTRTTYSDQHITLNSRFRTPRCFAVSRDYCCRTDGVKKNKISEPSHESSAHKYIIYNICLFFRQLTDFQKRQNSEKCVHLSTVTVG